MASPFLYDFRRTIASRSVLIVMIAMIMLSFVLYANYYPVSVRYSYNPPANTNTSQVFVYYDTSGYHFLAFVWNKFGQPIGGMKFDVNVSDPSSPSGLASGSGVTNASGITQFTTVVPESNGYSISLVATSRSGELVSGTYSPFLPSTLPGQTVSLFQPGRYTSPSTPTTIIDSSNASARDILVSWAGMNGSSPRGYEVYYKFVSSDQSCQITFTESVCNGAGPQVPFELNHTNAFLLGIMKSYIQIFHAPAPSGFNASNALNTVVAIGLTYPNGTSVARSAGEVFSLPVGQLYPAVGNSLTSEQVSQIVVTFFEDIFGLFIPLNAIVATYSIYGKDRVSGILESVLAQPVTRRGLALSRYVSSLLGLSIALIVSAAVLDLIAEQLWHSFINSNLLISSAAALLIELAAFIGIMMFLSHLVKSSGALIGIGVAMFLVIDFFQSLIVTLVTSALGIQGGSVNFYKVAAVLGFANPAQFVTLVDTYLTNLYQASFFGIATGSFPITPSSFGITIPSIIVTAVLWISVPLGLFLYLAIKRD
ncbi:MAG TPA: ABC transporter permease subunit [Nitrososphaerales archaeon]|nr:ABC transporter permease subunit [Nitrososphaerales archaeon]